MYESADQQARINVEFMNLGMRGMTVMTFMGDGGSHFSFDPGYNKSDFIGRVLNKISCN